MADIPGDRAVEHPTEGFGELGRNLELRLRFLELPYRDELGGVSVSRDRFEVL